MEDSFDVPDFLPSEISDRDLLEAREQVVRSYRSPRTKPAPVDDLQVVRTELADSEADPAWHSGLSGAVRTDSAYLAVGITMGVLGALALTILWVVLALSTNKAVWWMFASAGGAVTALTTVMLVIFATVRRRR